MAEIWVFTDRRVLVERFENIETDADVSTEAIMESVLAAIEQDAVDQTAEDEAVAIARRKLGLSASRPGGEGA